ncbi:hypothetical protein AB0D99_22275 [Streptomyces sp. NPDC047971]|uniref:hypothetical protein n=1 Tax=Streptomyces sp. NPDC047971 TaxID=3154499 RepID=UPI0033F381F0
MSAQGPHGAGLIAGEIPLTDVIARLRRDRPVFHSEADLQHSFARALWELAPAIQSRLEVRQPLAETDGAEHLDLMCIGPKARTAVEFKYFTARWSGAAGPLGEEYALASHAATDLGRLGFVTDIARLERYCTDPNQNGLALLLTNDRTLWTPPKDGARETRDAAFRIHEGRTLTGELLWGGGDYRPNTRTLRGTYPLIWQPYSLQEGPRGEFRYVSTWVAP